MCAEIVDLDALVGGDLTFKYEGDELKIPGDISTEKVFEIFEAFKQLSDVSVDGDPEAISSANKLISAQLLKMFQIRHPDMEKLPFGIKTLPVVIREILRLLGVTIRDEDGDEPTPLLTPSTPTRKKPSSTRKKRAAPRKKSPQSRGSQSS